MNAEFVNNTFISEDNFDWLKDITGTSSFGNVTSSQASQASSAYLHSLDLGLHDDDVNEMMADMNYCNYGAPLTPFTSEVVSDWDSILPPDTPVAYIPPDTPVELASPGSSTFAYTPGEFASPECSIFAYGIENEFEKSTAVEIDGTIVHIPEQNVFFVEPVGYVEDPAEYLESVEHAVASATPEHPVEYAVPLSVSSEMSTDDEEDCDKDPLRSSMSVTSDVSCDGSNMSSTSTVFTDDYLCSVSVKQLNIKIRDLAVSREVERIVKRRRRTLKNRGYAHSSRQKRNGRHLEVDEINAKLRRENNDVKRERDAYKREVVVLKRRVAQLEGQTCGAAGGVVIKYE